MADIFLSYSSEDKSKVRLIAYALEKMGWTVWWDRKIGAGKMYDEVIEEELSKARCVVVVWTVRSIASKWVKNEANAGDQRNILVPLMLEQVRIPLAFSRIEAAQLIDWNGEEDNPELKILMNAVAQTLGEEKKFPEVDHADDIEHLISDGNEKKRQEHHRSVIISIICAITGLAAALAGFYYLNDLQNGLTKKVNQWLFFLLLTVTGVGVSLFVTGIIGLLLRKSKNGMGKLKYIGPVVGMILILSGGFYIPGSDNSKTVTVRIFDSKQKPVTNGQVKLYLPGYIRQQSIDNVGQAQFTDVSSHMFDSRIKIEIVSDGFENYFVDTMLPTSGPVLITLTSVRIIHISGTIKTAGEMPIRDVEINVDGTKYYAVSITDGSYSIILKDYSPGDEITLTTSHKDYEDKTRSFRINTAEMKDVDFVLNPVK
ncbi:MAG: toll/interleukin-1 receptor domain-containing protein [Agriterribacter sp.]